MLAVFSINPPLNTSNFAPNMIDILTHIPQYHYSFLYGYIHIDLNNYCDENSDNDTCYRLHWEIYFMKHI